MEEVLVNNQNIDVKEESNKKELKRFRVSFVLFLIGITFMITSLIAAVTSIRGTAPIGVQLLVYLNNVAIIMFFVSPIISRKIDIHYQRSIYCLIAYFILSLVSNICNTSTDSLFHSMADGLDVSSGILLIMFFIEYLLAIDHVFKKYKFTKGSKTPLVTIIVFASLFVIANVCGFTAKIDVVLRNFYLNRALCYASMGINVLDYLYIFVASIIAMVYIHNQVKKELNHETK